MRARLTFISVVCDKSWTSAALALKPSWVLVTASSVVPAQRLLVEVAAKGESCVYSSDCSTCFGSCSSGRLRCSHICFLDYSLFGGSGNLRWFGFTWECSIDNDGIAGQGLSQQRTVNSFTSRRGWRLGTRELRIEQVV